jgi:hypothetical protein
MTVVGFRPLHRERTVNSDLLLICIRVAAPDSTEQRWQRFLVATG